MDSVLSKTTPVYEAVFDSDVNVIYVGVSTIIVIGRSDKEFVFFIIILFFSSFFFLSIFLITILLKSSYHLKCERYKNEIILLVNLSYLTCPLGTCTPTPVSHQIHTSINVYLLISLILFHVCDSTHLLALL